MSIEEMLDKFKDQANPRSTADGGLNLNSVHDIMGLKEPTRSAVPGTKPPAEEDPKDEEKDIHHHRKQIKDHHHKKLIEISDRLDDHLPIFESAGYKLKKFEVELGISPKIIPHFMVDKSVTYEQKLEALAKLKNKRLMHLMMDALIKAGRLRGAMQIGDLDFCGIEVHLSAIPTVRLLFGEE